jgi:hypothetical protein
MLLFELIVASGNFKCSVNNFTGCNLGRFFVILCSARQVGFFRFHGEHSLSIGNIKEVLGNFILAVKHIQHRQEKIEVAACKPVGNLDSFFGVLNNILGT